MHHITHKMAKFEGCSCFTSKVTAFFWKIPTAIFVNPGQCPYRIGKNGKWRNLDRKCILTLKIDLCQKNLEIQKISRFFPISRFSPKKWDFERFWNKIPDRDTHIQIYFIWGYKLPPLTFTLQKKLRLYRFSFFRYEGFTLTYDFHLNRSIFA